MKLGFRMFASLAISILLLTCGASAQTAPAEDYHQITSTFFQKLSEKMPGEAVEYVFSFNPWAQRKADEIQNAKSSLANFVSLVGEYQGNELIDEKMLGGRFVNVVYFGYFERQPIRFDFQFYKQKKGWVTYYFYSDDSFSAEMVEAAKAEYWGTGTHKQK